MKKKVASAVIRRLPKYYRCMCELEDSGVERISSETLSKNTGFTASQIRQDLNCFGCFGHQGYGYNVEQLKAELRKLMGLTHKYPYIIIGAGNIGSALSNYAGFEKEGFVCKAMFDIDQKLIGDSTRRVPVYHTDELEAYIAKNKPQLAVIAVTQRAAQDIANRIVVAGIKRIWNFSPHELDVPNDVVVENVHLSDSLFVLAFKGNTNQ